MPTLPAAIVPSPPPSPFMAPVGPRPTDDHDRWVADGFEAAHQSWLDDMGHANADLDATVGAGDPALTYDEIFPRLHRVADITGALR